MCLAKFYMVVVHIFLNHPLAAFDLLHNFSNLPTIRFPCLETLQDSKIQTHRVFSDWVFSLGIQAESSKINTNPTH